MDDKLYAILFHMEFGMCEGSENGIPTDNNGPSVYLATYQPISSALAFTV